MLTRHDAMELFRYDPCSGEIYWKVKRKGAPKHKPAGTVTFQGYRAVNIDGKIRRVHHVVWLMHKGVIPTELDHINNNPLDNRIENLRECSHQQNAVNRLRGRNNTSGYKGVRFDKLQGNWMAVTEYRVGNQRGSRMLGRFETAELAALAYNLDLRKHYPEFGHPNKIPGPVGELFGMS